MEDEGTFEEIDFEDLEEDKKKKACPDDFMTIVMDLFSHINYKLTIFLIVIFLFLSSDIFIDQVLGRFKNATENRNPTSRGAVIQMVFLVLGYTVMDLLIRGGVV